MSLKTRYSVSFTKGIILEGVVKRLEGVSSVVWRITLLNTFQNDRRVRELKLRPLLKCELVLMVKEEAKVIRQGQLGSKLWPIFLRLKLKS